MAEASDVVKKVDYLCRKCGVIGMTENGRCACGSSNIQATEPLLGPPTDMSREMCTENPNFSDKPLENYE